MPEAELSYVDDRRRRRLVRGPRSQTAAAGLIPPTAVATAAAVNTGTNIPAHRRDPTRTRLAGLLFRCFAADRMVMPLSP